MRIGTRIVVALLCAGAIGVTAACSSNGSSKDSGGSTNTITLGAALPLTGSLASEGKLTQEGYEVCEQQVNAQGGVDVGGKKMQLAILYVDDASKPDTAANLTTLFNSQGVKLVLSSYGSSNVAAQAKAIEHNGQVMADAAGADDAIFNNGYKRTFGVISPASEYAASMIQAINELAAPKPKSVVFLSADDGFSKTSAAAGEAAAKKLGFTVLPTEYFKSGSTDVSSTLAKIKDANPDVIIGSGHLAEGIAIIQGAQQAGLDPQGFGETVAPPTPEFVTTLGTAADGVLGSSQWTTSEKGSDKYFGSAQDYGKVIQAQFGHTADYHNAEASAGCLAMVLAIQKANSTNPDKVRDAMAGLDTDSFFGRIKFNDKGENVSRSMSVVQIQDGQVVTIWPKDAADGTLTWPGNH